jgi:tellurite resistance protein TerC
MSLNVLMWIILNLLIFLLISLDLYIFHNRKEKVTLKEGLAWSFFWISIAGIFGLGIWHFRGIEDAFIFYTGYLVEYSLSIDNLFVFVLMFKYFAVPESLEHKVLFWGILGAIVMRALFIIFGIMLVGAFHWLFYIFGIFLIITGFKIALESEKKIKLGNNPLIKFLHWIIPLTDRYEKDHFFVRKNQRLYATPLFIVLLAIESVDIIFAVDSIPAILAITTDPFLAYTSNIFAIIGLRSLYFPLSKISGPFYYIKYGLAIILVFIGLKMLFGEYVKVSTGFSLGFIVTTLFLSIITSICFPRKIEDK